MNQAPQVKQKDTLGEMTKNTYQKPELNHMSTWQVVTGSVGVCTPQDIIDGLC